MKTQINSKVCKKSVIGLIPILALGLIVFLACLAGPQVNAATTYIFATFDGDGASEQELWIYTSTDGSNWSLLADTNFQGPTGILRDPSIIKHTDGKYYIAYTNKSWSTTSTSFNIASSTNLTNWTHVTTVNAGISGTQYTWAPEFYIDNGVVKVIVSLSPAQPYAFKPYVYTAASSDLTTWSGGVLMSGIGPNIIDTYVVKSGSTYHAFTQNGATLYIEHATASSLTGPWTYIATGNWAGWGSGKEGPCLFQLDNGTWTLFADWYSTNGIYKATSSNLTSWSTPLASVSSLSTKRHGTVLRDTSFVPPATPTPAATPPPGTYNRIQSYNFPTYYVRQINYDVKIDPNVSPADDAYWKIVPGLANSATDYVSFESVKYPGYYLRHYSYDFRLDLNDGSSAFKSDATFKKVAGLKDSTWTSFQSYNYPTRYIRHYSYYWRLDPISTDTEKQDATWKIVQ